MKKTHKLPKINNIELLVEQKYQVKDYNGLSDVEKLNYKNKLVQDHYHQIKDDITLLIYYENQNIYTFT